MNAIMNEKGRQTKLLAAIAILAMVVCAFAVIMPSDSVNAEDAALTQDQFVNAINDGVYTVDGNDTITLTENLGSPAEPIEVRFDYTGAHTVTFTTTSSETVNVHLSYAAYGSTASDDTKAMFSGTASQTAGLKLSGNISMDVVLTESSTTEDKTNNHIAKYTDLTLENGADITMHQDSAVAGVSWYMGTITAGNGSVITLDAANGINAKFALTNADLVVKNAQYAAINVQAYSTFNGADITADSMSGGDDAKTSGTSIYFAAAPEFTGTNTIDMGQGDVRIENGLTLTLTDNTSIAGGDIKITPSTTTGKTATISGGSISGDLVNNIAEGATDVSTFTLTDTTLTGTNSVASGVTLGGTYTIGEKASLNVASGATMKGTATNNGNLNVNSGSTTTGLTISDDSKGSINISGTSTAVLGGTINATSTNTDFGVGQVVEVVDDLIIDGKGAKVTIRGTLNNPNGYSITIINGGQLIIDGSIAKFENNGEISVEVKDSNGVNGFQINNGATFVNNGSVYLEYTGEDSQIVMTNSGKIENNGTFEIDSGEFENNGTIINKTNGTFTIGGTYAGTGKVNNSGAVVINGIVSNPATINNVAEGATVTITDITGKITVTDAALESKRTLKAGDNSISFNSDSATSVGGVIITSVVTEIEKEYYKEMQISGTVDVQQKDDGTGSSNIYFDGNRIVVSQTLSVGENLNISMKTGTELIVSGTMNITDDVAAKLNSGIVTVTGTIVSVEEIKASQVNAAMYSTSVNAQKTYYYTTLDKAIAGATEAQVNKIEVTGDVTLDVDATIPSGMTVTIDNNAELTIDEVTLTVADGGKINNKSLIDVDGTLYITVEKTGISGSGDIESDVVSRGEADVRYTTLANAIAAAGTENVTISLNGNVLITSDLTIPENVTVDTKSYGFNVYGAKLTVDGTLFLNGTEKGTSVNDYYVHDNTENKNITKTGEVVVNGYIKSTGETIYDNKGFPAGAYYYVYGTESFYYITTVANAASAAQTADDGITIFGKNTAGAVEFVGTADEPVAITIANGAELSADSLKLTYATLDIDGRYDGTVTSDVGSVVLVNVTGVDFESGVDSEDVAYFAVAGEPAKIGKDTTDPDATMTVATGTVTVLDGAELNILKSADIEFVIDATLAIDGQMYAETDMVIAGTLNVNNGAVADFNANVYVTGVLNVAAATEDAAAGSASIGVLYIGVDDEYVGSPSASVTAITINELTTVYLLSGATVSDSVIEDLAYKTELYVEDALWITVYTNGVQAVAPTDIPTENVQLTQWVGTKNDNTVSKIANGTKFDVGNPARLDADIKYDIYTVTVFADPGIDAVYIDGKLMTKGYYEVTETEQSVEGFRLNISAGTHEITYKLGNYFSGEATMTVNGTAVSGNSFTTSGTDPEDKQVTIYLQGIEPSAPETPSTGGSSDDGMGLTDYLLIILVVLIVVMAIIVALRLMRS